VCGAKYEYCESCAIVKPNYNANRFCSHAHQDIYTILSKHGCDIIEAEDVLKELAVYNIDEIKLTKDIAEHLEQIKSEVPVVETQDNIEAEKQSDKNNKKKW
jgi:hypothetical protein